MLCADMKLHMLPSLGAVVTVRALLFPVLVDLPVRAHRREGLVALATDVARALEGMVMYIADVFLKVTVCQVFHITMRAGKLFAIVKISPDTMTMEYMIWKKAEYSEMKILND